MARTLIRLLGEFSTAGSGIDFRVSEGGLIRGRSWRTDTGTERRRWYPAGRCVPSPSPRPMLPCRIPPSSFSPPSDNDSYGFGRAIRPIAVAARHPVTIETQNPLRDSRNLSSRNSRINRDTRPCGVWAADMIRKTYRTLICARDQEQVRRARCGMLRGFALNSTGMEQGGQEAHEEPGIPRVNARDARSGARSRTRVYTCVRILQIREKPATLCHFLAFLGHLVRGSMIRTSC